MCSMNVTQYSVNQFNFWLKHVVLPIFIKAEFSPERLWDSTEENVYVQSRAWG